MTITQPMLFALLRNILSCCPRVSEWRKVSGRWGVYLVRFINWHRISSERKH